MTPREFALSRATANTAQVAFELRGDAAATWEATALPAPVDRRQCTGHVIFAMVELTDDALAHLARYVDTLAKRPLTAEALNDAQRAREQGAA